MLNADFKIGAGFPTLPAGGTVRAGGEFSGLYRQLHGEVSQFIENGSGSISTTAPPRAAALSPEGLWHQLQASGEPVENNAAAPSPSQQEFLREIAPLAEQAGQRLGVAPEVLAAHAALESGWGQKPIRRSDGSDSHNLFALKAGASWRGEVAEVMTTEYEQGAPSKRREGFRSYAGPAHAFNDFAQLLLNSPRYQAALHTGSDAQAYGRALQQGGYATDPAYADKLAATAQRIKAGGQ